MPQEITESTKINTEWSKRRRIDVAVTSLAIGLVFFILAYIGMKKNIGFGSLNQPILDWMVAHRGPQITDIMKIITDSASPLIFVVIIGVVAALWATSKREIWRPMLLVGSVGVAAGLSTLFKVITANSRPLTTSMIVPFEMDYSFPSGHTISVIVFLLVLGYLLYSRRSSTARIFGWVSTTILGTALIAVSRLYLGYHWLTDIVASIGLGLIVLACVIVIDIITEQRFKS